MDTNRKRIAPRLPALTGPSGATAGENKNDGDPSPDARRPVAPRARRRGVNRGPDGPAVREDPSLLRPRVGIRAACLPDRLGRGAGELSL